MVALEAPDATSMQSTRPQSKIGPAALQIPNDDKVTENTAPEKRTLEGSDAEAASTDVSYSGPVSGGGQTDTQSAPSAGLSGAAKGIAYILFERLGSVPTPDVIHLIRSMQENDKPILARLGLVWR